MTEIQKDNILTTLKSIEYTSKIDFLVKSLNIFYKYYRNFILYCIIGFTASSLDFTLFYVLSDKAKLENILANTISIFTSIAYSFVLNTILNFKTKDKLGKRFFSFLIVGAIGFLISSGILYLGIDLLTINKIPVKLFSIVLVAIIQYILNKNISFSKKIIK